MYCCKCGAEIPDGVVFCPQCGAKQETLAAAPAEKQKKKKKNLKVPLILGAVVLLIVVLIATGSGGSDPDYEASLRAYTPFANSQGIPYTCGEVFDKYLPDGVYEVTKQDDGAIVNRKYHGWYDGIQHENIFQGHTRRWRDYV